MKKSFALAAFLVPLSLIPTYGIEFQNETHYELKGEETLDKELWMTATTLDIQGTAKEDVFFFADKANLDGTFTDDVWGGTRKSLSFTGSSEEDLRVFSQKSVVIDGQIDEDLMAFAHTAQLTTNAHIKGVATINAQVVVVNGIYEGDLHIEGQKSITINADIAGNLVLKGKNIVIEPGTHIGGDLTYNSNRKLTLPEGVILDGELIKSDKVDPGMSGNVQAAVLLTRMMMFSATLIFGIFFIRFLPSTATHASQIIRERRSPAMMLGSIVFFVTGLLAVVAFISVMGMPLSILLIAILLILITSGKVVLGLTIGQLILKQNPESSTLFERIFGLFLGLLIITLASMLPSFIGGLVWFMLTFIGVGTMVLTMQEKQGHQRGGQAAPPSGKTDSI